MKMPRKQRSNRVHFSFPLSSTCSATLVALCAAMHLPAQATCTATATQPLVVTASLTGTQTQPTGPLPSTVYLVSSNLWERANLYCSEWPSTMLPAGATRWRVGGELEISVTTQWFANVAVSLDGQVRLHLQSPTPVAGLLYLWPEFFLDPFQTYTGDITIDVDADGLPDYGARLQSRRPVEIPVTLDASGRDIVVDLDMDASWNFTGPGSANGEARGRWDVVFLPNTFGLERRSGSCVPIDHGRGEPDWRARIVCRLPSQTAPPMVAGFFLLGLAEQNTVIPVPPNCRLLVDNPSFVMPSAMWPTLIRLDIPDVYVPPGLHFYCQGVWLDAQNQVFTSDSIRTM